MSGNFYFLFPFLTIYFFFVKRNAICAISDRICYKTLKKILKTKFTNSDDNLRLYISQMMIAQGDISKTSLCFGTLKLLKTKFTNSDDNLRLYISQMMIAQGDISKTSLCFGTLGSKFQEGVKYERPGPDREGSFWSRESFWS